MTDLCFSGICFILSMLSKALIINNEAWVKIGSKVGVRSTAVKVFLVKQ